MRRKLVTIAAAMAVVIALCVCEQMIVGETTRTMIGATQEILALIRAGDMEQAKEKTHALDEAWDEKAKILEMMVDHKSTDDVRFAFSKLLAALECGDRAAALIYAGELEGGLEHVCERQTVSAENLL